MNESTILKACLESKECYEQFTCTGDPDGLTPLGRVIYRLVGEYYSLDSAIQSCSGDVIKERLARHFNNPKHATAAARVIDDLPQTFSDRNFIHDCREQRRDVIGGRLSVALANRAPADIVQSLIDEYQKAGQAPASEAATWKGLDLSEIVEGGAVEARTLKLWPKVLNERCDGGASPGHHILVFARPEAGKTLFVLNMAAGFLKQGKRVLYIGNEEPIHDLQMRMGMRLLGVPKSELRKAPKEKLAELTKYFIEFKDSRRFSEVRNWVNEYRPDVLIIDQLRNMLVKEDSKTEQLEKAATEARAIGKEFNVLVVSVTQAGDSASGKVYLELNDVDSSKTGIPAAVDLMVGIGGNNNMRDQGLMGISLPKNKLSGDHSNLTANYSILTGRISNGD